MKIKINENILKIEIDEKINEISEKNLIELFCIVSAFQQIENKNGNEYDKAWLKIEYIKSMLIKEYMNIFKIIRTPTIVEFLKYFTSIEEKFNIQNTETRINMEDYIETTEEISQEIIISMIFNIKTNENEIKKRKEIILNTLKINNMDTEIFKLIKG